MNESDNENKVNNTAVSKRGRLIRELVLEFNHNAYLKEHIVSDNRAKSDIDRPFAYPEHLMVRRCRVGGLDMELLSRKDTYSPYAILHLHGGGYVGMLKNSYRTMAGLYSEVSGGADVLTIDYRVAPENPYPAALEDAFAAYGYLLDIGYKHDKIIFAGDSAGGGLAMALCMYLRDRELRLPKGLVAMSPWTDLAASGSSYIDNRDTDPVFGGGADSLIYNSPYIGGHDVHDPYISPLYGDFTNFPPMLIQVGTCEMLLSDACGVAKKALDAGVRVKLSKYEGMFHVFQMAAKLMPESKRAWMEVGKFISLLNAQSDREE